MYIYKITNLINGKVYIGQTIRPVEQRFRRHINDAQHNKIDTHFTRAIKKYGPDSFVVEIIDTALSADEQNQKEVYWINFYDACNTGYNTSPGGYACGGNTYANIENLDEIKEKLSASKRGGQNPHSRAVRVTDQQTETSSIYNSMQEVADALQQPSHMPVSRRCRGVAPQPYQNRYIFEYCNEESVTTIESAQETAQQVEQPGGETPSDEAHG